MPIIDVTVVHSPVEPLSDTLAITLADALGRALGEPEGRLWVRLHGLPSTRYAENEASVPLAALPVFVTVLLARLPSPLPALQAHAEQVGAAVSVVVGRPADRVHVE